MGWDELISGLAGVGESALSGLGSAGNWIGNAVRANPIQSLSLGMGIGGDLFGAYSAMQQQQQNRDLYRKQLELRNTLANPSAMQAGAQPYINTLNSNLNRQIPNIVRSQIAPQMGMSGVDPSSGQGQLILNQALAPYYAQNAQTGLQDYYQSLMGATGAGGMASGNVGTAFGGSGGTMQALQMMAMMNALRNGGGQTQRQPSMTTYDPVYGGTGNPSTSFDQGQSLSYLQPSGPSSLSGYYEGL